MKRQIAIISDCASPLKIGDEQCFYVAKLAENLAVAGYDVDVFTRRDSPHQPDIVYPAENMRVIHIPAGPASEVEKPDLLRLMPQFTSFVLRHFKQKDYDLIHANFFLSGLTALNLHRATETPFVVSFHGLGRALKTDDFPIVRWEIEDRIVHEANAIFAESAQEEKHLKFLYDAAPEKIFVIPSPKDDQAWQQAAERISRIYENILTNKVLLSATVRAALQNLRQQAPKIGFPLNQITDKQSSQNLVS
ncbi:MAG: glycosyltransferase [Acidobacteriota bacterium]|nr:glycosyltransferase [Acidobacteriota bacterium]